MFLWIVIFFRIVNIPAWVLLGLWFVIQLVSGLDLGRPAPGIAFWAHVGGFVAGMILVTRLRRSGTFLLQPQRSTVLATAPPRTFVKERWMSHGSVPMAGRSCRRPPRASDQS